MAEGAAFGGSSTADFELDSNRWPADEGTRLVFLLDARDKFEARLLQRWAEQAIAGQPVEAEFIRLGTRQTQSRLVAMLGDAWAEKDDPNSVPQVWFQPLRIAWLSAPRPAGGGLFRDLFRGRMTAPSYLRRRYIAVHDSQRLRYIVGAGAWTTEIHASYRAVRSRAGRTATFASWLQEQAVLVLELAERVERGARYKIPRLLPNKVFADQRFQTQMREIASSENIDLLKVLTRGGRYLREMAASQTPTTIDVITALYRASVRSSHDPKIDVPKAQLAELSQLMREVPVIFLISHKSMLDTAAFSLVLFNANLPIPLTFGGINLSTFGIGAFARRAGIIFLRRSFQDNAIYKAVFRRYIDYLIEKRFSLLWALEGTRSRTGKLLKPRFGLFNYVVDSILRTRLLGTVFVPVSVAYDQITEVEDYAIEQRGSTKKAEGAGWMLRFFRPRAPHGRIFVRMGSPITLDDLAPVQATLDGSTPLVDAQRDEDAEARGWMARSMAFETALRMNAATPVTANAIVTSILLERGKRALTLAEISSQAGAAIALYERRGVELVGLAELANEQALRATVGALHETGLVQYFDEGTERLYSIADDGHHKAAYYRNSAVHHFLVDALAEVALLLAVPAAAADSDGAARFVAAAVRLRGVLKFEFYFARKPRFMEQVVAAADERFPGWRASLDSPAQPQAVAIGELLGQANPLVAHWVLRSFVDAYVVAFDKLVALDDVAAPKATEFASECLKLGRQQLRQGVVHSAESVSKTIYQTAYELADHRGLTAAGQQNERRDVAGFMQRCIGALDEIAEMAVPARPGR